MMRQKVCIISIKSARGKKERKLVLKLCGYYGRGDGQKIHTIDGLWADRGTGRILMKRRESRQMKV